MLKLLTYPVVFVIVAVVGPPAEEEEDHGKDHEDQEDGAGVHIDRNYGEAREGARYCKWNAKIKISKLFAAHTLEYWNVSFQHICCVSSVLENAIQYMAKTQPVFKMIIFLIIFSQPVLFPVLSSLLAFRPSNSVNLSAVWSQDSCSCSPASVKLYSGTLYTGTLYGEQSTSVPMYTV